MNIPSYINDRHAQAVQKAIEAIPQFRKASEIQEESTLRWEIKTARSAIQCLDEHPDHRATYSAYIADLEEALESLEARKKIAIAARAYYADLSDGYREHLVRTHGFPQRHAGLTLLSWAAHTDDQLASIEAIHAWALQQLAKRSGQSVLLYGPPGTGKTHLACATGLHMILAGGITLAYSNAADIVRTVRSAYDDDNSLTEASAFEKFTLPRLLIMDEVGVGKDSEFSRETLHTVISKRYDKGLPTIFITNANAKDFRAAIMERAWDRLQEDKVLQIRMSWDSWRTVPRGGPGRFAAPFPPPAEQAQMTTKDLLRDQGFRV
jgi:DNA replication protein DnaC